MVVGRVVSLDGGRATITPYPTPRPSLTEAVVKAAQALVRVRVVSEGAPEFIALKEAVKALEALR